MAASLLAIAALLFAQLAVAGHACTRILPAAAPSAPMQSPCDMAPGEGANLCERHCLFGDAATDSTPAPCVPPAGSGGLRVASPASLPHRVIAAAAPLPHPSPPLLRRTVLRL